MLKNSQKMFSQRLRDFPACWHVSCDKSAGKEFIYLKNIMHYNAFQNDNHINYIRYNIRMSNICIHHTR